MAGVVQGQKLEDQLNDKIGAVYRIPIIAS